MPSMVGPWLPEIRVLSTAVTMPEEETVPHLCRNFAWSWRYLSLTLLAATVCLDHEQ